MGYFCLNPYQSMKPWENPQAHEAVFSVRKFVQLKDVENTPEGPGG